MAQAIPTSFMVIEVGGFFGSIADDHSKPLKRKLYPLASYPSILILNHKKFADGSLVLGSQGE
jgi:hypothetical protein